MKKTSTLLFFVLATLTFVSCNSDEIIATASTDPSLVVTSMTIDAANASDVQKGIEITSANSEMIKPGAPSCAVITVDNAAVYPKVFTVDFGNGCTVESLTRKGKLKISISKPLIETGSVMTIERINYSINNLKLEGTIKYTNTTIQPTVPQWTREVTDGKFTNGSGKIYLNSGSCTVKQTEGVNTPYLLTDNVYEMTAGEHTISTNTGISLVATVITPLVKKYNCEFISQGKLKVVGGLLNGMVDYGNNSCDSNYIYTHENGVVFQLQM